MPIGPLRPHFRPADGPNTSHGAPSYTANWVPCRSATTPRAAPSETRRFPRAAAHFLTPAEAALGDDPRVAGVVWCAKETLYKLARRRGIDLLRDLAIERIDFAAGEVVGRVRGGEPIPMRLELREGLIVVHTL